MIVEYVFTFWDSRFPFTDVFYQTALPEFSLWTNFHFILFRIDTRNVHEIHYLELSLWTKFHFILSRVDTWKRSWNSLLRSSCWSCQGRQYVVCEGERERSQTRRRWNAETKLFIIFKSDLKCRLGLRMCRVGNVYCYYVYCCYTFGGARLRSLCCELIIERPTYGLDSACVFINIQCVIWFRVCCRSIGWLLQVQWCLNWLFWCSVA